jgi:hypothetical protein
MEGGNPYRTIRPSFHLDLRATTPFE